MQYYAAPMEGLTDRVWRQAQQKWFGPEGIAHRYYAPFLSPPENRVLIKKKMAELAPAANPGAPVIPQLLAKDGELAAWMIGELRALGYTEVNLNLGCPSGTVTAKGKGSGFLAFPDELDAFFSRVSGALGGRRVSVKTRLGLEDACEFERLLNIYSRHPLCELIIHPRVRRDMYKLPVRPEGYALAYRRLNMPLCYNGDIFTAADAGAVTRRFPKTHALMLGRGLSANPALAREMRGGPRASVQELREFHDLVYAGCARDFGNENVTVPRMKELWSYLRFQFAPCPKEYKRLAKAKRPDEYLAAARDLFANVPVRDGGRYEVG